MAGLIGARFTSNARLKLERTQQELQKHLLGQLKSSAQDIANLATLNAPIDTGATQDAIIVEKPRRDGTNFAYTFTVGVNTNRFLALASSRKQDWKPFKYFEVWLHESQYELGPKSLAKQQVVKSVNPKAQVGNKYLYRAQQSLQPQINEQARKTVNKVLARQK